jgi:hypothetical protein
MTTTEFAKDIDSHFLQAARRCCCERGPHETNFAVNAASLPAGGKIVTSIERARRVVPLVLIAALAGGPAPARAGDPVKPLRTLIYDVALTIGIVRRRPRSGPSAPVGIGSRRAPNPRAAVPRGVGGSGEEASGAALEARGTIAVEVIAATGDGGLVADVSESAPGRTRAKVRFAVSLDGTVAYDPKRADDVTEEETSLARWLARGFYADHPREAGAGWTVDQSGNGLVTSEHYRVLSAADQRVTLTYALEQKSDGPASFAATRAGSLVYDTGFVVPIKVTYEGQTRRQLPEAFDETRTSVVLTLTADSFAKKS